MSRYRLLILNTLVYWLSALVPRSPAQWVFGHLHGQFAGNPKYLFLWLSIHRPDIRITWLSDDAATRTMLAAQGFHARSRWSIGGIMAVLRAKILVFAHGPNDINAPLSKGAFLLNLWHGVGLKSTYLGDPNSVVSRAHATTGMIERTRLLGRLIPPDLVVTTSDFMQDHFARQFHLPAARCPQLGYPRLDAAADPALAALIETIDQDQGFIFNPNGFSEVYAYLPTFRDSKRPFFDRALPDLAKLSAALAARHAMLYIKPHPETPFAAALELPSIQRWPDAIDIHPYLGRLTGLITDYSSVLYDYLFLRDTGAILYTFDLDEYLSQDRSLLYPFADNVAGLSVTSFDGLCDAIGDGRALATSDVQDVERIRMRFWGGSPSPASPAIIAFVEQMLDANGSGAARAREHVKQGGSQSPAEPGTRLP